MNRFDRLTGRTIRRAAAIVLTVSCASNGETSRDTQPSIPFVRLWIEPKRSAAEFSDHREPGRFSPDAPLLSPLAMAAS